MSILTHRALGALALCVITFAGCSGESEQTAEQAPAEDVAMASASIVYYAIPG